MPDPATYTTTCAYCSAPLTVSGKGKYIPNYPRYCSKSHKQMGWRAKQTAAGIPRKRYEKKDALLAAMAGSHV